jgi:hypothetical protein
MAPAQADDAITMIKHGAAFTPFLSPRKKGCMREAKEQRVPIIKQDTIALSG